jgi:S1-C subfamily serine protease
VAATGRAVTSIDDLFDVLQAARGGSIDLNVVRGADERTIQVAFGDNSQPEEKA